MKRLFSRIRIGFSKLNWIVRRKYNQFKHFIVFNIKKFFAYATSKDKRDARKLIKLDHIKDENEFNDYNLDVRFDMDLDTFRESVVSEYKNNKKVLKDELKQLKLNDESLFNEVNEGILKEQERIQAIFNKRLELAVELQRNIRLIEEKREKEITEIANKTSDYDEKIESIRKKYSKEAEKLRQSYNKASKQIYLNNKPSVIKNETVNKFVLNTRLKTTYKSLPISRKALENKDRARQVTKGLLQALIYLAPVMILLMIFTFYPIVNALRLSVYINYSEVDGSYDGLTLFGNFKKVLTDANFIFPAEHTDSSAMINTLVIVGISVPIAIAIGLLIAVLLNSIKPLSNMFQTIFFLPYVTNSLAVGLVFAYMFQTNGLFNKFLSLFNINGGAWIGAGAQYWKAMFVLLLFSVWNTLAFKIMVFLSAIQGIDKQYYQAASIDATPRFKQFRRITAPLISPTILYVVITSVIGSFKTYSSVIAIFGKRGQPPGVAYNLKTIVFYIYDFISIPGNMAEAAAASIVLFIIILIMTLIQMQVSKKRVHY